MSDLTPGQQKAIEAACWTVTDKMDGADCVEVGFRAGLAHRSSVDAEAVALARLVKLYDEARADQAGWDLTQCRTWDEDVQRAWQLARAALSAVEQKEGSGA